MAARNTEEKPEETTAPRTFNEPLDPSGDGRVTLRTRFPYGEYKSKQGTVVKSTGTNVSATERDAILAEPEAAGVIYQVKTNSKED